MSCSLILLMRGPIFLLSFTVLNTCLSRDIWVTDEYILQILPRHSYHRVWKQNIKIVTHHFVLNICIYFRLHFHNPSFGLHREEEPSSPAPPPALIPGQHQYTNPIESSGSNNVSADLTTLHNNIIRWTHLQIINLLVSQQFQSKHAEIIFPSPFSVPCGKLVFCL